MAFQAQQAPQYQQAAGQVGEMFARVGKAHMTWAQAKRSRDEKAAAIKVQRERDDAAAQEREQSRIQEGFAALGSAAMQYKGMEESKSRFEQKLKLDKDKFEHDKETTILKARGSVADKKRSDEIYELKRVDADRKAYESYRKQIDEGGKYSNYNLYRKEVLGLGPVKGTTEEKPSDLYGHKGKVSDDLLLHDFTEPQAQEGKIEAPPEEQKPAAKLRFQAPSRTRTARDYMAQGASEQAERDLAKKQAVVDNQVAKAAARLQAEKEAADPYAGEEDMSEEQLAEYMEKQKGRKQATEFEATTMSKFDREQLAASEAASARLKEKPQSSTEQEADQKTKAAVETLTTKITKKKASIKAWEIKYPNRIGNPRHQGMMETLAGYEGKLSALQRGKKE